MALSHFRLWSSHSYSPGTEIKGPRRAVGRGEGGDAGDSFASPLGGVQSIFTSIRDRVWGPDGTAVWLGGFASTSASHIMGVQALHQAALTAGL